MAKPTQHTSFPKDAQLDVSRSDVRASGLLDTQYYSITHDDLTDVDTLVLAQDNDCVAVDAWIADIVGALRLEGGSNVTK